jgi:hypothetical protein
MGFNLVAQGLCRVAVEIVFLDLLSFIKQTLWYEMGRCKKSMFIVWFGGLDTVEQLICL